MFPYAVVICDSFVSSSALFSHIFLMFPEEREKYCDN